MKSILKLFLLTITSSLLITSCKFEKTGANKSKLTGWNFNDPKYGNYLKGNYQEQKTPLGMVYIEGGTFTMGSVQDDVMSDWNTTPKQLHVRSFYIDETEVTNSEYLLYTEYMKDVFPPEEKQYKHIYKSVLPDTLVWREGLANTDLLSENYFRHPAYSDYPVVGVSWIQANQFCKWRTDAVNLKALIDKGIIKNIFKDDSLKFRGKNRFDTETYLKNPYALFDGDSSIYKKGLPDNKIRKKRTNRSKKGAFIGRHVTSSDGVFTQRFRLPTEAEWEYAAKATFENRTYNNIRGLKKYSWNGKYTRNKKNKNKGDQLANFKQKKGNYSGIAGWSSDGADIPAKVKSYPPNAFGLYDMSGNVAEWVADVYRPNIDTKMNDFNYFRGNIFTKTAINKDGKVVIVTGKIMKYDTLGNGKIVPKYLPGSIKEIPITKNAYLTLSYKKSDNSNLEDGDQESSRFYAIDKDKFSKEPKMYNSPKKPKREKDSLGNIVYKYDSKNRTTLIGNRTRVYKGGSWKDRAYWLDPGQRRYLPEYVSTNYIGFRCASVSLAPIKSKKNKNI